MVMTILITGASKGIGAELAVQLAEGDHRLILVARNDEALRKVCDRCNNSPGSVTAVPLAYDLTRILTSSWEFIQKLQQITDSLDVLVNNAGFLINKPFAEISPEESKMVFVTNYFVPEQLIRACLPLLKASTNASVINVTSMGAVQGSKKFPGLSSYSASKGALATLTECLAEELAEDGIRVNALALGAVQTEMLEEAFPGFKASTNAEEMGRFFKWFVVDGWKRFNGKMLPVSDGTP
jgi:3-oxoacyl-[acyl-carrier protein] reductase